MAYKLQIRRGLLSALPIGISGEPLFATDTNDLYISNGTTNQKFQKFIASGTSSQFLKGDGSLDSNTYYLASNPSAFIALSALSASAPLSYNNTTGVFTIAQATGSVNGYLSSTDWTTFNNKQATLSLTTTGTSGAATLVGATLNIPQYADQFVGTVTSVSFTLGGTGTDLNSSVTSSTTTPSITLNVPTASATNRGALSSADWSTFNGKQVALNGTGFVKISGTTISYDNSTYYLASNPSAFIALTALSAGTGISYNNTTGVITNASPDQVVALTASTGISVSGTYPNFTITNTSPSSGGTVTSVGLSSATSGVTIGSSPITTSGTITLAIATATTSQNGLLSSADWTTFNAKQNAITLTTTGTSGAATLVGSTLNVPNYGSALTGYVPYTGATQALNLGTNNGIVLTDTGINKSIFITSSSTGEGAIVVDKSGTGDSIRVNNGGVGSGFYSNNSSTGNGVLIGNSSTGKGLYIDNAAAATGDPFVYSLGGAAFVKAKINYLGDITGNSLIKSGGTSSQYLMADGSTSTLTNPVTGTGTTNYVPKWTSGSAIGNSLVYDDGTNVGVGTLSPLYKVDIKGGNASTLRLNNDGSRYVQLLFERNTVSNSGADFLLDGTNATFGIRTLAVYPITFSTSASAGTPVEYARLTTSGNLLVNSTTDNGNRLQVTGDGSFTGQVNSAFFYTTATSSPSGQEGLRIANNNGYIGFFNGGNSTRSAYIQGNTTDLTINTSLATPILFGTSNVEKMRLDSSGNLGLGVTPSAWVAYTGFQIGTQGSIGATSTVINFGQNVYYGASGNSYIANGNAAMYQLNDGVHGWRIAGTGTAGNAITFTQAMTLTSNGNLLLNTTTDSGERLVISGSGRFVNQLRAYNLLSDNQIKGSAYVELSPDQGTYNAWNIRLGAQAADACYYITGGGVNILTTEGYNNPYTVKLYSNGVQTLTMTNGAATFSSSVTAGNSLTVNAGANDGIFSNVTGAVIGLKITQSNSANDALIRMQTNGHFYDLRATSSNALSFDYDGSERARFTSGGNLLVGTTTDSGEKLQVAGTGKFTGSGFGSNGIHSTGANGGNGIYTVAGGSGGSGVYGFTNDLSSYGGTFEHTGAGSGIALRVIGWSTFSQAATFSSSVTATQYNLSALNTAPATSSSTGTLGEIRIDANHIYVCTATNTWKRVAIATF